MSYFRYNIATSRKVNLVKLVPILVVLLAIASLFFVVGFGNLSSINQSEREKIKAINELEGRLGAIRKNSETLSKGIQETQKKWNKRITYVNQIIAKKSAPFLQGFNYLEEKLPKGVFIHKLSVKNEPGLTFNIGVMAASFSELMGFYQKLPKQDLVIKEKSDADGYYRASFNIRVANEKN